MVSIHPTAIVSEKAALAENVTIGPFTIVEADVEIGEGTQIGPHCKIDDGARIGKNCTIHQGVVVSTPPQDLKYNDEKTYFELGDNCVIREYCTLNRGTVHSGTSKVGSDCLLMAYVHVAHDCFIGDKVIISNSTQLGGHVHIGYHAIVGGLVAIHQFVTIGAHTMTGGGIRVLKDVPPYALAGHTPATFEGINSVGLRRRGFSAETRASIEEAYQIIYRSGRNVSQAVEHIKATMELTDEVQEILNFIDESRRGIIKLGR
ncbi:MAG: acyl-[acyl-carrier-protein]--UDP-N-acetylglucosamine O-acyltransferase [Ectothiorhodospiraceae bacterium]|nr:acyl-[acyl-carrier-protein]--UDP-N-acetylglucosamine O-acyltransferase [Ectothiorhodospiraceae bacterium]